MEGSTPSVREPPESGMLALSRAGVSEKGQGMKCRIERGIRWSRHVVAPPILIALFVVALASPAGREGAT
jgi:hypothetical protein